MLEHIPLHIYFVDVDEASNITATKETALKIIPWLWNNWLSTEKIAYVNTSNHKSIHILGKSKSLWSKFILTGRGCQIQHPTQNQHPKNLAQYIDYVNVHHLHIRLPHVGFGSSTYKTLTLITLIWNSDPLSIANKKHLELHQYTDSKVSQCFKWQF